MSQLSNLLINRVEKNGVSGYNIMLMYLKETTTGYTEYKPYYINLKSDTEAQRFSQNFVKYFIQTNGHPKIFANSMHNRKITETYKFFIDLDFPKIESTDEFNRKLRNIQKLFAAIKKIVGTVFSSILSEDMIIWGRDIMISRQMKFHIHFPQIITDTSTGPDVIEYIRENIDEIPGFTKEEIYLAIDPQPARGGNIRLPLSIKIETKKENGKRISKILPNSEYFLYTQDIEMIKPNPDDIVLQSKFITNFNRSLILVFDDNITLTKSDIIDNYRKQKYINEENLSANYFSTNELISEIREKLREMGIGVQHRGTVGKIIKFDTNGPHPCPVSEGVYHSKENIFCVLRPTGVYVFCYASECSKKEKLLIERKFTVPITTSRFLPRDAGYYTRKYGLSGGYDYMNKFFATNAQDGGLIKFEYDQLNPDRIKSYDIMPTNYNSIISCNISIPQNDGKPPKNVNLGRLWVNDENRRFINHIEFMDPEDFEEEHADEDDAFNAFIGFNTPVENLKQYWDINNNTDHYKTAVFWFKRHVRYFWCFSEGRKAYNFTMDWLSWVVRNPTKIPKSALCLVGELGTLKSGVFDLYFREFFGQYYMSFTDPAVVDKWKGNLQYKMFVVWDEAKVDANLASSLKALITEHESFGALKNVNHKSFKNTASFVIITNDAEKFQVDPGTRRYMFINTYNLFTRGYFDEFKINKTENECNKHLRPIINMTKDEYFDMFFNKIDWKDIISYFLFDHKITPNFSTQTIVTTAKLLDLKIKSDTRLAKFLVEAVHTPGIYDRMEELDIPIIENRNTYTHRISSIDFISLINDYVPEGKVSGVNIGTFRTEIKTRLMRCIKLSTDTIEDITSADGQETVTYFYMTGPDEVAADVARIMGATIEDIKNRGNNDGYIFEENEPEL